METLRELTSRYPKPGQIVAIYLRPARGEPVLPVDCADAIAGQGLQGDRAVRGPSSRANSRGNAKARHLTLLQAEALPVLETWSGISPLNAGLLRRNIVVSGLNLAAMRSPFADGNNQWRIGGNVVIEVTGPCEPCSKMEQALGTGGYNMMRGHGGLTAAVLTGGQISVGDLIAPCLS